jgi:uncharacterized protein (TIRG00374 family)
MKVTDVNGSVELTIADHLRIRIRQSRHALRGIISLAVLATVALTVDVGLVLRLLKATDYMYLSFALVFLSANKVVMAYRWNVLTEVKKINLSLLQSIKISLMSNFFGSFLPSGIGSDVYRIYHTGKKEGHTGEVAASVIMERFVGMLTRSVVAVMGVILILNTHHQTPFGRNLYGMILGFCALSGIAFWLSMHDGTVKILLRVVGWWGDRWILTQGLKFQRAYIDYKQHCGALIFAFMLSLISVVLLSVGNYYAAISLGMNVGIIFYFGIISIVNIVNRIPISVGGLGITEGTYVILFASIGVSTTEAFALALLVRITECVFVLVGGLLYMTGGDLKGCYPRERGDT